MSHDARWKYPAVGALAAAALTLASLALNCARARNGCSLPAVLDELRAGGALYAGWFAAAGLVLAGAAAALGRRHAELRASALEDAVTELPNRRHFEVALRDALACARHCRAPLTLLMIDVDRLKRINDRNGHEAGDLALKLVALAVRATCRGRDFAARWGGDEFAVLAAATDAAHAVALAERLRANLRELHRAHRRLVPRLSVSIGAADLALAGESTGRALFAAADRALYLAKQGGRDRVRLAQSSWSAPTCPLRTIPGSNEEESHEQFRRNCDQQ